MRSIKTLILLALVTLGVVLAAFFYQPPDVTIDPRAQSPLLPALAKQLDAVQTVEIQHSGETVTLQRRNGAWTVAEKAGYPARGGQIRELLLGLARLRRAEPKTRNPQYYSALGLTDADRNGGMASHISLLDAAGHPLVQVTLGKRPPSAQETARDDLYALLPDDPQSWRVEGKMPTIGAAGAWLNRTLLDLDRTRIAEVTLIHGDGETVRLVPKGTDKGKDRDGFTLEGMEADEALVNDYVLDDIASRFTHMQLEDVQPADQIQWPANPDLKAEMRTKDGLLVRLIAAKIEDKPWIRLMAEAVPNAPSSPPSAETPEAIAAEEAKPPTDEPSKETPKTKIQKTPEQEVTALNGRWQGWAYTLAEWAYQALDKHRVDLIKAPETKPTSEPEGKEAAISAPAVPTDEGISSPAVVRPESGEKPTDLPVSPTNPPAGASEVGTP